MKQVFGFLAILLFLPTALAGRRPLSFEESRIAFAPYNDGYISSIDQDSVEPMKELVLITPPMELRTGGGTDRVFTQKLQKEFRDRYRDQFGFTYSQEFLNNPIDVSFYGSTRGYTVEEEQFRAKKRGFGEYVVKKTVEYHADNYFKNDPQLKTVYEVKEKLSHLDVKVDEQTKVMTNYDLAGNYISTNLESRYVHARLQVEFGGETTLSMSRGLTPTVHGEVYYKFNEGKYAAVTRKRLTERIETSLTLQRTEHEAVSPRESLFLLGFSLLN